MSYSEMGWAVRTAVFQAVGTARIEGLDVGRAVGASIKVI